MKDEEEECQIYDLISNQRLVFFFSVFFFLILKFLQINIYIKKRKKSVYINIFFDYNLYTFVRPLFCKGKKKMEEEERRKEGRRRKKEEGRKKKVPEFSELVAGLNDLSCSFLVGVTYFSRVL